MHERRFSTSVIPDEPPCELCCCEGEIVSIALGPGAGAWGCGGGGGVGDAGGCSTAFVATGWLGGFAGAVWCGIFGGSSRWGEFALELGEPGLNLGEDFALCFLEADQSKLLTKYGDGGDGWDVIAFMGDGVDAFGEECVCDADE